ncbi:MAG: hypothetical protein K0S63_216 [Gammaproteobacteria bacterium]|jgi:hypothetical protein|nr:hypothetical protein [Gammaproteobacteria bacterium]
MTYDAAFIQFYQDYPHLHTMDLPLRLTTIANSFLGVPYQFEPLGEGENGIYSTFPLYRADQFDCVTFVDTVLAMANATNFFQFEKNILSIRYRQPEINYIYRTDWFTDLEWNPRLQQLGFIKDTTQEILDSNQKPIAEFTTTIINKPEFYEKKTIANLNIPNLSLEETQKRLIQLRSEGEKFTPESSTLAYIHLSHLFDTQHEPNAALWNQLPAAAIIEIVRPNWRPLLLKDNNRDYGTHLNVSHLGIAIRTLTNILFYHASINKEVVCLPFVDYLKSFLNDQRPTPVSGIHIETII